MLRHPTNGIILLSFWILATITPRGNAISYFVGQQENSWIKTDSIKQTGRIVFYNVENLFHPSNDSLKADDDFTPAGAYHWTYIRYLEKIKKLGKLFVAVGEGHFPGVIGLCEVENRQVLNDLLSQSVLRNSSYRIIHKDSPDPRGIDVALLYDPNCFYPTVFNYIPVNDSLYSGFVTRDILHVSGLFYHIAQCHIFVNHWPSRKGGKLESQDKRLAVAQVLRQALDLIFQDDPTSNVIILGDFNDEPEDLSIKHVLEAGNPEKPEENRVLYNLMYPMSTKGRGTHFRLNNFTEATVLDQIIVSRSVFMGHKNLKLAQNEAGIYKAPFLLNKKNGMPLRTYQGLKYLGGFSDHLPVYIDIQITASL